MLKEIKDLRSMVHAAACITFVAAWMMALSLGLTIAGVQAPDKDIQDEFAALGGMQIAFTCLAVLLCIPSVVRLAIRRDTRRISLWQLIGASSRAARWRYMGLAAVSSFFGALLGGLAGYFTWPLFGDLVVSTELPSVPGFSQGLSVWAWSFGSLIAFVVLFLSLLLGTRAMKKIEPVQAIVETPDATPTGSFLKTVFTVLFVGGVFAGYLGIAYTKPVTNPETLGGLMAAYWGTALGLLAAYGISDRHIIRPVVILVGKMIPLGSIDAWAFARTSARRRSVLSTSVITPLVFASATVGCIFGMVNQTKNVMLATGARVEDLQVSPTGQIMLILGSPVIIATVSGILSVYLTNEWRSHDIALLQTLGASKTSVRCAAVCECVIYFVSAALIALLLLGLNAVAIGRALGAGPVPGAGVTWFGNETFYFLIAGFSLLTLSIVIPTLIESRSLRLTAITS